MVFCASIPLKAADRRQVTWTALPSAPCACSGDRRNTTQGNGRSGQAGKAVQTGRQTVRMWENQPALQLQCDAVEQSGDENVCIDNIPRLVQAERAEQASDCKRNESTHASSCKPSLTKWHWQATRRRVRDPFTAPLARGCVCCAAVQRSRGGWCFARCDNVYTVHRPPSRRASPPAAEWPWIVERT